MDENSASGMHEWIKSGSLTSDSVKKRPVLTRSNTSFHYNPLKRTFTATVPPNPAWENTIRKHFPGAIREESFVNRTHILANQFGFQAYNTLSCVSVCRDELCSPFLELVERTWKAPFLDMKDEKGVSKTINTSPFNMSSLAGMLFLGKTGMSAAISHAPVDSEGKQRFVFFVMPHVGIDDNGNLGQIERPGHETPSNACGALVLFHEELLQGFLHLENDADDVEYILMKQRLLKKIKLFSELGPPSLEEVTILAHQTILEDLEHLISQVVIPKDDYVVLSGIQIHTPGGISYIWPQQMYAVVDGKKTDLVIPT